MLCTFVVVYEAHHLRGLYADGAYYLLQQILSRGFFYQEPARMGVHFLQQWPTVLSIYVGISDAILLGKIYSFTLLFTPIALIFLSFFFLPEHLKYLFLFPVYHYLAGVMSSSFAAIGEVQIAGAYFWPLFYLLLFYNTGCGNNVLLMLASIATLLLHEAYLFIAPIFVIAAYPDEVGRLS